MKFRIKKNLKLKFSYHFQKNKIKKNQPRGMKKIKNPTLSNEKK